MSSTRNQDTQVTADSLKKAIITHFFNKDSDRAMEPAQFHDAFWGGVLSNVLG